MAENRNEEKSRSCIYEMLLNLARLKRKQQKLQQNEETIKF